MNGWTLRILVALVLLATPLAGAADEATDEVERPTAGFSGGFFIQSPDGNHRLRTQARVQARYQFESMDAGEGEDRENETQFSIPRARLKLSGHVFNPDWRFTFQADFGKGFVGLKDFYVEYRASDWMLFRVGQFKRPFSRQQLTSSGRQEFVDRAITDRAFGAGRDIGLMLHNGSQRDGFEWAFGVFNGTGDKGRFSGSAAVDPTSGEGDVSGSFSNVPDNLHPALVLRGGYNYGGIRGYREADLEGGPLRFAAGASGQYDLDVDDDGASRVAAELDYMLKAEGFSTTGGVYWASVDVDDESSSTLGFHAQAGYLIGDLFQPAVRFAMVDPEGDDNNTQELGLGLSFYFFGHGLKWQNDVSMLTAQSAAGDLSDIRARSQLQLSF